MDHAPLFSVRRANCLFIVPREHPASDDVRRKADDIARRRLPEAFARVTRGAFPSDDSSIWIIERLSIDIRFDPAACDDDALAELWSARIAVGVGSAIRSGEGVYRFQSRAAFIAEYVASTAAGRDSARWDYGNFEGLASLPVSARVRTAFSREPEIAADVLAVLAQTNRLVKVLCALDERSANEVWQTAFPRKPNIPASAALFAKLLALWDGGDSRAHSPQSAIRLAVAANGYASPEVLRLHIDALFALAAVIRSAADPWSAMEILQKKTDLDDDVRPFLVAVAREQPEVMTCAISTLRSSATVKRTSAAAVYSRFAGLALLLEPLASLALSDDAGPQLRALVAMHCAGPECVPEEIASDPILQLFTGSDEPPDEDRSLDSAAIDVAQAVMRSFASRLPGFADSSFDHLRPNLLEGGGTISFGDEEIRILLDPMPLAILLRMTGIHRTTFTLPWLADRSITLLLHEELA